MKAQGWLEKSFHGYLLRGSPTVLNTFGCITRALHIPWGVLKQVKHVFFNMRGTKEK
jgi:hypothetical protein